MPLFRIERYEIHTQAYLVEADSEAEAVKKTLDGSAEVAPDEFAEFDSFCESCGMLTRENPELTEALRKLGVIVCVGFIPGIKSVEAE